MMGDAYLIRYLAYGAVATAIIDLRSPEAVTEQLATLDYAPAFQYTHPGATTLANRLTDMAPGNLNHAIFTNSGSECADTALKLARAYWRLKGQPSKTRFHWQNEGLSRR